MGSIKGLLTVSIFVINGLSNDFFMGLFFFCSTIIGFAFFTMNPYSDPKNNYKKQTNNEKNLKQLYELQFRIKKEEFTKEFGWAYKFSCLFTILSFFLMVVLYMNSPEIPIFILKIHI